MRTAAALLVLVVSTARGFAPASPRGLARPLCSPPLVAACQAPLVVRGSPLEVTMMASEPEKKGFQMPFFLNIGTKGGIVFYSVLGIVVPWIAYSYMLDVLNYDIVFAGNVILVGYVGALTVLWTASYVFRVANKDMTYAQQLRDYENAVIQKRFEELSEDEVDALMGEIYPGQPGGAAAPPKK